VRDRSARSAWSLHDDRILGVRCRRRRKRQRLRSASSLLWLGAVVRRPYIRQSAGVVALHYVFDQASVPVGVPAPTD
jgi:hypothetical protein